MKTLIEPLSSLENLPTSQNPVKNITEKDLASLTDKQAKFVKAYLRHHNGTQAAIEAGYAPKSASVEASRLLKNPSIRDILGLVVTSGLTRQTFIDFAFKDYQSTPKDSANRMRALELAGKALGFIKPDTELESPFKRGIISYLKHVTA